MTFTVLDQAKLGSLLGHESVARLLGHEHATSLEDAAHLQAGDSITFGLPEGVQVDNIDSVGFALIAEHPMALELAGVILLMAMLGAVVLARKQVEIGEAEKSSQADLLGGGGVI